MIYFVTKNNLPKVKNPIKIILSGCESKEDAILLISKKLNGRNSPDLLLGYSLDTLFSVVSDFFIDNWLNWGNVYIYGWGGFSSKNPILAQKILNLIMEAYFLSISSKLQLVEWGELSYEDSNVLLATKEKKPCMYFVLD